MINTNISKINNKKPAWIKEAMIELNLTKQEKEEFDRIFKKAIRGKISEVKKDVF